MTACPHFRLNTHFYRKNMDGDQTYTAFFSIAEIDWEAIGRPARVALVGGTVQQGVTFRVIDDGSDAGWKLSIVPNNNAARGVRRGFRVAAAGTIGLNPTQNLDQSFLVPVEVLDATYRHAKPDGVGGQKYLRLGPFPEQLLKRVSEYRAMRELAKQTRVKADAVVVSPLREHPVQPNEKYPGIEQPHQLLECIRLARALTKQAKKVGASLRVNDDQIIEVIYQ